MTSSRDLLTIFEYLILSIDFVHVFKVEFWAISDLQSSSKLHQAKTQMPKYYENNDVMMTSSGDLLLIFEYLFFPIVFVHRFEGVF